ncbi:DUF505 domain-containing protein [Hippea sp. KM1]|uniref:DUF505 domain-containing protein n=1 Tax=Hippea sp. KM1 TaxID=944481 RepID=UPI00046D56B7|nr:DUF505 domain-containing protein [Hippea sp. KM1]
MVIGKPHALALRELLKEYRSDSYTPSRDIDNEVMAELEVAGLVRQKTPLKWTLTYSGLSIAELLEDLYNQGPKPYSEDENEVKGEIVIKEGRGLPEPEDWPDDFRFIGSEIMAMIDAADKAERVGPKSEKHLIERGLAIRVWDTDKKKEMVILSEAASNILKIYKNAHPRLIIDDELAEFIRKVPMGPTTSDRLPLGSHYEHMLEGMRLIAYSAPISDVYIFTALGQAIKNTLLNGGFSSGTVISEDIMWSLANHVDGVQIPQEALSRLKELAYIDNNGELLKAGEWLLEAFRVWHDGPRKDIWTIAIEKEEVEVLETIDKLNQRYAETKSESDMPTFENLRNRMIDKRIEEYKALIERYGKKIKDIPQKYRKIAEAFQQAKDLKRWYDDNFMLREELFSLESFDLIESTEEKNREIFRLTEFGRMIIEDQKDNKRSISSTAVKAITMTKKTFSSPSIEWLNEAKEAGLIGNFEATSSGQLYAKLSETINRKPHLTNFEAKILKLIPAKGITIDEVYNLKELKDYEKDKIKWAIEKLEARRIIEVLPDGNIIETPIGQKIDSAVSGVPDSFANPVNPVLMRMLISLRSAGTLYVKERKIRVLPKNIKKAQKISNLSEEAFYEALKIARTAGFVGSNSITTSGVELLEAFDMMKATVDDGLFSFTE